MLRWTTTLSRYNTCFQIPDIDLLSRKNGLRVDCLTGETYLKNQWDPPPVPEQVQVTSSEEDEGGEEEMDEEEEEVVNTFEFYDKNYLL